MVSKITAALIAAVAPVAAAAGLIFHFNLTADQTTVVVAGATALITAVGTIFAVVLHQGDVAKANAVHVANTLVARAKLTGQESRVVASTPKRVRPSRAKSPAAPRKHGQG